MGSLQVSVILLTRNRAEMLRRCIQSILTQTYPDFELIILDHNSSDNTKEVIDSFGDERIRYYLEPEESSIPIMRNKGTKLANGEWISVFDDDDIFYPNKLEEQMKLTMDYDMIYCGWCSDDNGKVITYPIESFSLEKLYFGKIFTHITLLIRKTWLEKFPYDESYKYGMDYKMALTMARNNARFGYVDKTLCKRYFHSGNLTKVNSEERIKTVQKVREQFMLAIPTEEFAKLRENYAEIQLKEKIEKGDYKVSIIIPYYKKEKSINQVLEAIEDQTYKNYEIIVVDDGSDEFFLNSFGDRDINYFWHKDNGYCLNSCRNIGRRLATGKILLYLDADIVVQGEDFLERIVRWHLLNPNKIVTFHRIRIAEGYIQEDNKQNREDSWHNFSGGMFSIEASVFDRVGNWDEAYDGEWGFDDIDFGYRAIKKGIPVIVDKSFIVHHLEHPVMEKPRTKNPKYFNEKFGLNGNKPISQITDKLIKRGSPMFINGKQVAI